MGTTAIVTLVKMMESLPETAQNQAVEYLREYLADLQDEMRWDNLFQKSQAQLVAAARFHALPAPPAAPTLILASRKDRLVSVECSKSLAGQWQCPLRLHASAGHDLPLDDGPWVATQVRDWMRGGTYLKKAN